jgi:hypothetical protein
MLKTGGISLFLLLSFFYGIYSFGEKHVEAEHTKSVYVIGFNTFKKTFIRMIMLVLI